MKNIVVLITLSLFVSCGSSEKKKKGFEYNRTQKEEKKNTTADVSEVPIDLNNKGIGPVKSLTFDEAINQDMAEKGEAAFKQKCTACHMVDRKLIGPSMKGIYERRSPEWVVNFLLNPTEMLQQDPIAKALLKQYNNVMMLNQNLSEEEARAITEYLRTL
ncbi:cytochrome c [Flavobacteriaceae bacterium]|nr:cytochrome c [Flavobacteriaceae bacterium]